jgi:hypothetical protein
MSDIEREEFEQAVTDRWSDSYSFTRFGDEDYYDEVLEGMWWGWQASRQAIEGEPVAVVDRVGIMQRLSPYTNLPEGTKLYTHPASAQAPEEIERDGINSTENLAYIDGYNDCAKEVRENARSNKRAVSVPDDRISVHEYTARMALQALEEYAENLSIVAGWDYEPLEHHYAQQAIEEIESLLPEPPKQEKGQ